MSANSPQWDQSCDVLVVGSGAGAMTAALRAHDLGLQVQVVEKSDRFGGTSAISGGGIWIPCNHRIAAAGGQDSAEEAVRYIRAVTHDEIDDGRIEAYVEHGHRAIEYLEQHSRVRFEAQAAYADYYPEVDGGKPGFRSMDPLPFDARELGEEFQRLREPSPGTLMMGRMTMTMKEARVLLCRGPGWVGLTLRVRPIQPGPRQSRTRASFMVIVMRPPSGNGRTDGHARFGGVNRLAQNAPLQ